MYDVKSFFEFIEKEVKRRGIFYNDLCKECGVSREWFAHRAERRDIFLSHADRVCSILGVRYTIGSCMKGENIDMGTDIVFQDFILSLVKKSGMTIDEFAKDVGFVPNTVTRWALGYNTPRLGMADKLCRNANTAYTIGYGRNFSVYKRLPSMFLM